VLVLAVGADDFNFYTVDVDIFSPYGKWTCGQWGFMPSVCNSVDILVQPIVTFTLEKGDTAVYLTVTDDSITVSMTSDSETSTTQARLAEESDTSTTQAALGDDNTKPRRDRDTWSIRGTEGETVTVTLEEDPSAGHSGEQATLILRNGGSTIKTISDVLPIEITTTLPSDGEYQLIVEQNGIPEDVRFRGRYFLSVISSLAEVQDIEPNEDVEQ